MVELNIWFVLFIALLFGVVGFGVGYFVFRERK